MSDSDDLTFVGDERFSAAISQFLGLANSSEVLTFLMGAGCSKCAGLPLTNELTDRVLSSAKVDSQGKEILTAVKETVFSEMASGQISKIISVK